MPDHDLHPVAVPQLSVLIAEDHQIFRDCLKMMLNKQADLRVVGEAGDGQSALRLALQLRPDVAIIDVKLPSLSGIAAARQLKNDLPQTKVLMLSAYDDSHYVQESFRAGASGYLLKRNGVEELIHAVRAVAAGGTYLDPVVAGQLLGEPPQPDGLSAREAEVLRLLAWGYENREIADRLGVSVKTVEADKVAAMATLGLHSRVDIVRCALIRGWLNNEV